MRHRHWFGLVAQVALVPFVGGAGCTLETDAQRPPQEAAPGSPVAVAAGNGALDLDRARVPVLEADAGCEDGQVMQRSEAGWACATPPSASVVQLPAGVIVMWSGSPEDVPEGWLLCDGTDGTPDLRDRFIVGSGGGLASGDTGGVAQLDLSHTHTVAAHSHPMPHSHPFSGETGKALGGNMILGEGPLGSEDGFHHHQFQGATDGPQPATTGPASLATDVAGAENVDVRPPFYALAFIIKVAR